MLVGEDTIEPFQKQRYPAEDAVNEELKQVEEPSHLPRCAEQGTVSRITEGVQRPVTLGIAQQAVVITQQWDRVRVVMLAVRMVPLDRRSALLATPTLVAEDVWELSREYQRVGFVAVGTATDRLVRAEPFPRILKTRVFVVHVPCHVVFPFIRYVRIRYTSSYEGAPLKSTS